MRQHGLLWMSLALPGLVLAPQAAVAIATCARDVFGAQAQGHQAPHVQTLASGLNYARALAVLPDRTVVVAEKAGRLRLVGERQRMLPVPAMTGLMNLLDVVPHPRFADNRQIFFAASHGDGRIRRVAIHRFVFSGGRLHSPAVHFEARVGRGPPLMNAGAMVFAGEDTLVASTVGGAADDDRAQRADSYVGKVIRMCNRDAGPCPAAPRWLTSGHRTVQGLAYDRNTGALWATEHGPLGGDELNLLRPGANYGWPLASEGRRYTGEVVADARTYGFREPILAWPTAVAPAGVAVYAGRAFPRWQGNLLVATLAGRSLRRLVVEGERVRCEESLLSDLNRRWRDVAVDSEGRVLVISDGPQGVLLRLQPDATAPLPAGVDAGPRPASSKGSNRL